MKFKVNKSCVGCGACEWVCPQVFKVKNGKAEAEPEDVPVQFLKAAIYAMESCPACAILDE